MNFKSIFALLIIFLVAASPVSAAFADFNNSREDNKNNIVNYNVSNNITSTIDLKAKMNYTEMLDYLLYNNQPNYILCDGSGADLSKYSFSISNISVNNYHNLSDNYKGIALDSDYYKGTLYYTNNNSNLKSVFITNSDSDIDTANWTFFNQDIKNTQYLKSSPLQDNFLKFPFSHDELFEMFNNTDPIKLNTSCNLINKWVSQTSENISQLDDLYREASVCDIQNTMVAKARSNLSNKYWSPDIFSGYYEDIDDNQLQMMNVYDQNMKILLDKIRYGLDSSSLEIDYVINLINTISITIPSNKDLKFTILNLKAFNLDIKNINYKISVPYHRLDQDTMNICAEKDYRCLISEGIIKPHYPTEEEIAGENKRIDDKISDLNTFRTAEYDRIFNLNSTNPRLDEKVLYPHFSDYIDKLINTLNDMRWKV
jgi:hypothetical protein